MLLPSILINGFQTPDELIQAGIFGIGPNNNLNQWTGRDDVSFQPLWQLEALGSATWRGSRSSAVSSRRPSSSSSRSRTWWRRT